MQISLDKKIYPKNNCNEPHITIGEEHPAYDKLLQGYDFEIDKGYKIKVKKTKTGFDYKNLKNKLKKGQATSKDIQKVLAELL